MTQTFIIEKLGTVSLRTGIVYVQCLAAGADAKDQVAAELAIPLPLFGQVAAAFQSSAVQLQERLKEIKDKESQKSVTEQKDPGDPQNPVVN